jgi:hypothetical protein
LQQLLENGRLAVPRLSAVAICQIFQPAIRGVADSRRTMKLLKLRKPFERTTRSRNTFRLWFPVIQVGEFLIRWERVTRFWDAPALWRSYLAPTLRRRALRQDGSAREPAGQAAPM